MNRYRCSHVGCREKAFIYAEFPLDERQKYKRHEEFKLGHWCKKHLIEALEEYNV